MGDKEANLYRAIDLLDKYLEKKHTRLSSFIQTKSWGFEGADFLNAVVVYDSDKDAFTILDICKRVEAEMGRPLEEPIFDSKTGMRVYSDRIIDIDILMLGNEQVSTTELTIPHPRMKERDFVLIPLKEVMA